MSRQQRPSRPILGKSPEQRLAAIIRRHGGTVRAAEAGYHLPAPREALAGQLDMFAESESG